MAHRIRQLPWSRQDTLNKQQHYPLDAVFNWARSGFVDLVRPLVGLDQQFVIVCVASTLILLVQAYHRDLFPVWLNFLAFYLFLPLFVIVVVLRESPGAYGFGLGDWRAGIPLVLASVVLIAPVLWLVVHADGSFVGYYAWQAGADLPFNVFCQMLGWEFLFRGFILFGYARRFGAHALWLQTVPFALFHITKPELETVSTLFGGLVFGLIAWRTKSFLYPFLIHWFVMTFTVVVSAGLLG